MLQSLRREFGRLRVLASTYSARCWAVKASILNPSIPPGSRPRSGIILPLPGSVDEFGNTRLAQTKRPYGRVHRSPRHLAHALLQHHRRGSGVVGVLIPRTGQRYHGHSERQRRRRQRRRASRRLDHFGQQRYRANRTAVTDERGAFTFSSLFPGTYDLTVELSGFKTTAQVGIVLSPNDTRGIAIRLEIGGEHRGRDGQGRPDRGDADRNRRT